MFGLRRNQALLASAGVHFLQSLDFGYCYRRDESYGG